jgi:hypothetical protein
MKKTGSKKSRDTVPLRYASGFLSLTNEGSGSIPKCHGCATLPLTKLRIQTIPTGKNNFYQKKVRNLQCKDKEI